MVAKLLSTEDILWSNDFKARDAITVDPEGSPLGSAMADSMVMGDGDIQTTASWSPEAQPSGMLILLSTEEVSYQLSFNIEDEKGQTVEGARVTLNNVSGSPGEYVFSGLQSGTYDYQVEKEGYLSFGGQIILTEDETEDVLLYALTPGKYYVSADGNDSNPGNSPGAPWKTFDKAINHSYKTGDDVYFRCGDKFIPSRSFDITWQGTEDDAAVIGSYYMDGETAFHGINDDGKAILSGNNYRVPDNTCYGTANS
jgi:hypothetical protein